ncbi:anion exchange protein 3-like protein, partial [Aphelenchoides avenae]
RYTEGHIGMSEMLLAQCLCGVLWAVCSAQPLIIMSATGPMLVFEASLYAFCKSNGLEFTTVRQYAGAWIFAICVLVAAFDGARLLSYVTRFTEDIFATLISAIFISESLQFLYRTFVEHPIVTPQNIAIITAVVLTATYIVATLMDNLRENAFLGKHIRRVLGDFGVLIAVVLVSVASDLSVDDTTLEKLNIPAHFNFTTPADRIRHLFATTQGVGNGAITVSVGLVVAMLAFVVMSVQTGLTGLILLRKEMGCKKGGGMNWDLLLLGTCAVMGSFLGLPWMCAGPVQSLAHCSSLTVMREGTLDMRPVVDHVIEQRVTTVVVSLLIGAVTVVGPYLRLPLACLFGVFLYLGVRSLLGIQLTQRALSLVTAQTCQRERHKTQRDGMRRLDPYTVIQATCALMLYLVKHFKQTSLGFPFVLVLFAVFRQVVMPVVFTEKELNA